jgi:ABC-2 type transport system permease protein
MNKFLLVMQREYMVRVRKKSFVVMSLLGPLLIVGLYGIIGWTAYSSAKSEMKLAILDESGLFKRSFDSVSNMEVTFFTEELAQARSKLADENYDALLYIPQMSVEELGDLQLFSESGISATSQTQIERRLEKELEERKLRAAGVDPKLLDEVNTNVELVTYSGDGEEETSSGASTIIGFVFAFIIYFFIFLYGAQVMRGVLEEKTSRIVEVIISSVKPFELMMGKIIGIALVGLTQIAIWVVFGILLTTIASFFINFSPEDAQMMAEASQAQQMGAAGASDKIQIDSDISNALGTINFPLMVGCFMFYYLVGYLMYASLFGAIGAAVDSETDSQQFMFPVTVPLILSIALSSAVINNPNGGLAMFLSLFPLTSPVSMMLRLPFIGFTWEVVLSMVLLVVGFLGATWLASRIYRIGILMYGKKPSWKEMGKWLFSTN